MRVSRDGKRLALAEDAFLTPASVVLLDLAGRKQSLGTGRVTGIAWNGPGDEVWYSQDDSDGASGLWAVRPSGARRLLLRHAGSLVLQDVSRDGTALVSVAHPQMSVMWLAPGASRESDMAWLDGSAAADISADGRTLLLDEFGSGGGATGGVYLRKADGSPAVRLGDGLANSLSADGKWVLVQRADSRARLVLVPTGPGETRTIPLPTDTGQWWFFPDGRRILVNGAIRSGRTKMYSVDLDGKSYRQIAPDGFDSFFGEMPISPDGKWIDSQVDVPGVSLGKVQLKLFPAEGGEPRTVPGFEPDDVVIRWAEDGKALFVFKRDELPARVFRLDIETGKRTPWLELMPADRAGVTRIPIIVMTPDGKGYAYNLTRDLSDLFLVRGLE
jgi:hypothetical protein